MLSETFKAAAKLLKAIFDSQDVKDFLKLTGSSTWRRHRGGALFERMVRRTKRCLRKVIGQARFSFDEMLTAIIEIEGIINSHPICYLNAGDIEEPLTPSHLLVGRRVLTLPDNLAHLEVEDDPDFEVTDEVLQRRAKYLSSILNHFWKRWSKEYLSELREAHRQKLSSTTSPTASVGDVVLMHDQDHPQGFGRQPKYKNS